MPNQPLLLEMTLVTLHGEPITGARVRLAGGGAECEALEAPGGVYAVALPVPADYQLVVERYGKPGGYDHRTLRATLFYLRPGSGPPSLRVMRQPEGDRASVDITNQTGDHVALRVKVDYLWFSHIGRPPTQNNLVRVLVDGEQAWGGVADTLAEARQSIHVTTWIYQPSAELVRKSPLADPPERQRWTVHELLATRAKAGVLVRLLLWDAPFLGMPDEAQSAAERSADSFEVLEEANTDHRPLLRDDEWHRYNEILGDFQVGSYHQKTVVVDGTIGFCGGMNLKENDWDTRDHRLFDASRCRFSRLSTFRRAVQDALHLGDHRPRHDFIARVEGPAVADLEANFRQRWNRLIAAKAENAERATPMHEITSTLPAGPSQVQVVRTMPEPYDERGILDIYLRAIGTARKLIYIEDQYFRSTHVSDAIADAVRAWPSLQVIVVTAEDQANDLFSGGWSRECFTRVRDRYPSFELYALKVHGVDRGGQHSLAEVDNHAKLMIVDDLFMTVGSANVNDRSFEYEGEINLAIVDAALARETRLDLWREHLSNDPRLGKDLATDIDVWKEHATHNRHHDPESARPPKSRIFPFEPSANRLKIFGREIF